MMTLIFSNYGCEVFMEDNKYYVCYDSGESSGSQLIKKHISKDDFEKIKKSEKDAYAVLLKLQN
jgi:hypothetical protein